MKYNQGSEEIAGTTVRFPVPIVTVQSKKYKKKCCKKYKKGKRCKKCPGRAKL